MISFRSSTSVQKTQSKKVKVISVLFLDIKAQESITYAFKTSLNIFKKLKKLYSEHQQVITKKIIV